MLLNDGENLIAFPANPHEYESAEWVYNRIVERIVKFESALPNNMQAGGRLVSSSGIVFSINDVGYYNPNILVFTGDLQTGEHIELLQHISQLSLLLVAVPRKDDVTQPRRMIGFRPEERQPEKP